MDRSQGQRFDQIAKRRAKAGGIVPRSKRWVKGRKSDENAWPAPAEIGVMGCNSGAPF
jgi:hypothetical protein